MLWHFPSCQFSLLQRELGFCFPIVGNSPTANQGLQHPLGGTGKMPNPADETARLFLTCRHIPSITSSRTHSAESWQNPLVPTRVELLLPATVMSTMHSVALRVRHLMRVVYLTERSSTRLMKISRLALSGLNRRKAGSSSTTMSWRQSATYYICSRCRSVALHQSAGQRYSDAKCKRQPVKSCVASRAASFVQGRAS